MPPRGSSLRDTALDAAQLNGIDDFDFTPVPEPRAAPLLITAISVLAAARRIPSHADRRDWRFAP